MAIPPSIPPTVRAATPTVPYTSPTASVLSPRPPTERASSIKGEASFTSIASERRYNSMKAIKMPTSFLAKKEENTSAKRRNVCLYCTPIVLPSAGG